MTTRRADNSSFLPVLMSLVLFAALASFFAHFTCDDAYITYQYARHLASGQGLTFNPGEVVEGYSNFLWMLLLAGGARLGGDVLVLSKVLGLLSGVGALLLAWGIVRRVAEDSPLAGWVLLLPATQAGLLVYAMSGLETIFYAFWLTGAVYGLLLGTRRGWWAAVGCGLAATLTRPEGLAILVLLLLWRAITWSHAPRPVRQAYGRSVAVALATVAAFFCWRHATFGDWLPNTYYAKPPGAFGNEDWLTPLAYLRGYLLDTGGWLWLSLLAAPLALRKGRVATGGLVAVLAVEAALVLHARGDWMALYRFLVPLTPLLMAFGLGHLLRLLPQRAVIGTLVAVGVTLSGLQLAETHQAFTGGVYPYSVMAGQPQETAGRWLAQHYPAGTTLACKRIGAIKYVSGMKLVDILGLTDRRLARLRHASAVRGEAEYTLLATEVLSRKPDLVLLCPLDRWPKVPDSEEPPNLVRDLRDVDGALYRGLKAGGYRFATRLPQGSDGELLIYQRPVAAGSQLR